MMIGTRKRKERRVTMRRVWCGWVAGSLVGGGSGVCREGLGAETGSWDGVENLELDLGGDGVGGRDVGGATSKGRRGTMASCASELGYM